MVRCVTQTCYLDSQRIFGNILVQRLADLGTTNAFARRVAQTLGSTAGQHISHEEEI